MTYMWVVFQGLRGCLPDVLRLAVAVWHFILAISRAIARTTTPNHEHPGHPDTVTMILDDAIDHGDFSPVAASDFYIGYIGYIDDIDYSFTPLLLYRL